MDRRHFLISATTFPLIAEQNFKQAGLFMIIGGILMIIFVGGIIYFIGLIFAVLGFFNLNPKNSQNE